MFVEAATLAGLALGTLVSEDLASISAGLLVRDGEIRAFGAVIACSAGVYLGDLGLWLTGRVLGRRALALPWLAGRLNAATLEALSVRLDARLGPLVIGGQRPVAFALWSLAAVLLWTPPLVLLTAAFGPSLTSPVVGELGYAFRCLATAGAVLVVVRTAMCQGRKAVAPGVSTSR
jgi:membrane protein DedA with SNARE-associated domain